MTLKIPKNWSILKAEEQKPYWQVLSTFVAHAYEKTVVFPPQAQIFSALQTCAFEDVKVVILGQDPYHGKGQANGLSFSVSDGVPHPPSLVNIFKEIRRDLGIDTHPSGNLERWAKQGVLLLNTTLTVEEGKAGSHQKKGWETFTDAVIQTISEEKSGVVFMLWGGNARKKVKLIDQSRHHILESGHPSPLSANRGHWFGNGHFSKANGLLDVGVDWR